MRAKFGLTTNTPKTLHRGLPLMSYEDIATVQAEQQRPPPTVPEEPQDDLSSMSVVRMSAEPESHSTASPRPQESGSARSPMAVQEVAFEPDGAVEATDVRYSPLSLHEASVVSPRPMTAEKPPPPPAVDESQNRPVAGSDPAADGAAAPPQVGPPSVGPPSLGPPVPAPTSRETDRLDSSVNHSPNNGGRVQVRL